MVREIITVQLGNYSNHVATHWWNIQSAHSETCEYQDTLKTKTTNYNSYGYDTNSSNSNPDLANGSTSLIAKDVLWRSGESSKGEDTCTPRTVILDEKHNMGTMAISGGPLYDTDLELFDTLDRVTNSFASNCDENIYTWSGKKDRICSSSIRYTEHQNALNMGLQPPQTVKNPKSLKWPDYSYTYHHPKSIFIPTSETAAVSSININQPQNTSNSTVSSNSTEPETPINFSNWMLSNKLWARTTFRDEFEDRIRFYAEETDWLEGFQILSDSPEFSGFGALANHVCHYFDDDYHKKVQMHFPISKFGQNFLCRKAQGENIVPKFVDWTGVLGKALLFYDLSLSTSAADSITPLSDLTQKPSNFYEKFDPQESDYHSTATLACYLEAISSPYRTCDTTKFMRASDIVQRLTSSRRRIFLDTKMAFRDDQISSHFCSLSGLNISSVLKDTSYSSLPVARGVSTSPDAYWCNTDKVILDPKHNHFFPKILKNKSKKSRNKTSGEVIYADWCANKSIGTHVRSLFDMAKTTPKYILANISVKYEIELDELNEAFVGFYDVLDNYEDESVESEESDDDY